MLLDEKGLKIGAFEPVLADILGRTPGHEGAKILALTGQYARAQVQIRDWLYCLGKGPSTMVRRRLVDPTGKDPDVFIDTIECGDYPDEPEGPEPPVLTSEAVSPAVMSMLESAERIARDYKLDHITDSVLTLALLDNADSELLGALESWTKDEDLKAFRSALMSEIGPPPDTDVWDLKFYSPSGRKFCAQFSEDARSLGAKKVTTRHMLYTLLGNETSLLHLALANAQADVKRELHSVLARQLVRPGGKRNDDFSLGPETAFEAVAQVLKEAAKLARDGSRSQISEFDISRAFVVRQPAELSRLMAGGKPIDVPSVRAYTDNAEYAEDEEEDALKRFTIREIEENVKDRIRGQTGAIDRVIPWIKRLRFGILRDGRPAAVFLFLGPTGAGKTQLAKELARYVFGDEDQLIYLEMGQFKTKESMSMFIGAPPGYVGYGDGKLTNGLKDKPESIVLFDEIEKADTQVFDTVLRFSDEGVISDPAGPVRDGRKCIIVMTTNAGQQWLRDYLISNPNARENPEDLAKQLFEAAMKELEARGFRPEFLGRVDERIVFLPFSEQVCREIVDGVLDRELPKFEARGITIEVREDARNALARSAFDRSTDEGARGAPRAINEFIITKAIDLLAEAEERGEMPSRLIASTQGIGNITLEVEG